MLKPKSDWICGCVFWVVYCLGVCGHISMPQLIRLWRRSRVRKIINHWWRSFHFRCLWYAAVLRRHTYQVQFGASATSIFIHTEKSKVVFNRQNWQEKIPTIMTIYYQTKVRAYDDSIIRRASSTHRSCMQFACATNHACYVTNKCTAQNKIDRMLNFVRVFLCWCLRIDIIIFTILWPYLIICALFSFWHFLRIIGKWYREVKALYSRNQYLIAWQALLFTCFYGIWWNTVTMTGVNQMVRRFRLT